MPENTDEAKPKKRGPGRPRKNTQAESGQRQRERAAKNQQAATRSVREISDGFTTETINWDRRLKAKTDPEFFCHTYMPKVFYLSVSSAHRKIYERASRVFMETGKFALAMPRGSGKTASCRGLIIWGTAYGWKRFPFFIGSKEDNAKQTLDFIKTYWYTSPLLREDFPEIAYPIHRLENRHHLAKGQLFGDKPTHIEWGSSSIRYPSVQLTPEQAAPYLYHDPDSLLRNRDGTHFLVGENYVPKSAGIFIRTSGIDGSIRGEADIHPVTLEQPRPDLVLLDDIQKDQKANSVSERQRLISLIDGAVDGLSGPDEPLAVLMPCTVTAEGDVSDQYLCRELRPEYSGERCSMIEEYPKGIDDYVIDPETVAGRHWLKYDELRRKSLREFEDIRLASAYYLENQKSMDKGFDVSWADRFNGDKKYGHNREYSAIQHAMNRRLSNPATFPAEYQNKPKNQDAAAMSVTVESLMERVTEIPAGTLPPSAQHLVAFIDVQNEALFWFVMAVDSNFTGSIVDWGIFPEIDAEYFTKRELDAWSYMTRDFLADHPAQMDKTTSTKAGGLRAPLEAKIYHAVSKCTKALLSRPFRREASDSQPVYIKKVAIDARWGKATDAIKLFVNNQKDPRIVYSFGEFISPAKRQYEEYNQTDGWLFEHQLHFGLAECKWVYRPAPDGYYALWLDVNRLKTFGMSRLSSPLGAPGAISINKPKSALKLQMLAEHLATSEYPEPMSMRGRTKEIWNPRDGEPDNDWLDGFVGCLALASWEGARIKETDEKPNAPARGQRQSLREQWEAKRGA